MTAAGTCVALAIPDELLEPLPPTTGVVVVPALVVVLVPLSSVPEGDELAAPDVLPELTSVGKLVVITVFPSPSVLVSTLGAPEILPAMAAPRSSSILLSNATILVEYCVGMAVNQSGVVVAVNADSRIERMFVPETLWADATDARAGRTVLGIYRDTS
jgi:hypothetical protein